MEGPVVGELVVAKSPVWRAVLRDVAEIARFSDLTVLLLGASGTGKEVVARLIDLLDARPDKRDLVILDCSSITSELSGSEFFGHERGALRARFDGDGAFAWRTTEHFFSTSLANSRFVSNRNCCAPYKNTHTSVGEQHMASTRFRLVCATHHNLVEA